MDWLEEKNNSINSAYTAFDTKGVDEVVYPNGEFLYYNGEVHTLVALRRENPQERIALYMDKQGDSEKVWLRDIETHALKYVLARAGIFECNIKEKAEKFYQLLVSKLECLNITTDELVTYIRNDAELSPLFKDIQKFGDGFIELMSNLCTYAVFKNLGYKKEGDPRWNVSNKVHINDASIFEKIGKWNIII